MPSLRRSIGRALAVAAVRLADARRSSLPRSKWKRSRASICRTASSCRTGRSRSWSRPTSGRASSATPSSAARTSSARSAASRAPRNGRPGAATASGLRPRDSRKSYGLDNSPIKHEAVGQRGIRLTQPVEPGTGIEKEMVVTLDETGSGVTVLHRLTNRGKAAFELAPWALTIMNGGGTAIVPQEPYASTRTRCCRRARWCSGTTRISPTRASRSGRSSSASRPTRR